MATLLSKTKSSVGSPYVYYQLDYSTSNRTGSSIDINVTCNSNLASSSSSLGTGSSYGINGYLTINGNTYTWVIKSTSDRWSGTTNHTSYTTITAPVGSSDTTISGITFQAIRSNGSTSNAGYLSPVGCNNVTFESFHTPPLISGYTLTEANATLTTAGVGNNVFVANLSQKQVNINYTLYDGATFLRASAYNGVSNPYLSDTLPFTIDFRTNPLYADTNGVPMLVRVTDNQGGGTYYTNSGNTYDYYTLIPYTKPTIIGSAKRVGQISGQVAISCSGTIYNGTIGNVTTTKPTITYSYYEYPSGTIKTGTISSSSITLSSNTFSVSNYNIGSTSTSATNYFDPEKAYRITINVADKFTGSQTISFSNTNSSELPIAVGEATWTEYKDRVDFKKITINGGNAILNSDGTITSNSRNVSTMKELYSNTSGSQSVDIGEDTGNYNFYVISWGAGYGEKATDVFIPNFGSMRFTFSSTGAWYLVYNFSNSGNTISMAKHSTGGWGDVGKIYKIIGIKF